MFDQCVKVAKKKVKQDSKDKLTAQSFSKISSEFVQLDSGNDQALDKGYKRDQNDDRNGHGCQRVT